MNKKFSAAVVVLLLATMVTAVSAQVSYTDPWFTSYQVANLGTAATEIVIDYYDSAGASAGQLTYAAVPAGGSVTVQQSLEPTGGLTGDGRFSAVISAGEPIAAVANQQLGTAGSGSSIPPFSSYSGASAGAMEVTLPSIMYNWWGYYTEITIQNVGTAPAASITIEYFPTKLGGCVTGATGQTENVTASGSLAQYAGTTVSQVANTSLGAPTATGCTAYDGRFLGSAKITSDQPIVAIVNEHVQGKLFTYNGFTEGADTLLIPAYMRNYYNYYVALVIANPGTLTATVDITYTNGATGSDPGNVVTGQHTVPAGENITIYEGDNASGTDLTADYMWGTTDQFFGTALVKSDQPVVAMINQESTTAGGAQAGTYNGMAASEGSTKISVPLIQSAFYGYYTSLTIMTVDGGEANLNITYTSDGTFSSVLNHSETYSLVTSGGFPKPLRGTLRYGGPV